MLVQVDRVSIIDEAIRQTFSAVRVFERDPAETWRIARTIPEDAIAADKPAQFLKSIEADLAQLNGEGGKEWLLSIPKRVAGGFNIDVSSSRAGIRGLFGDMDVEFASLSDAMVWVERALSDAYQLRIISTGGQSKEWHLEPVKQPSASPSLATGQVTLLSWIRTSTTTVLRNASVPSAA